MTVRIVSFGGNRQTQQGVRSSGIFECALRVSPTHSSDTQRTVPHKEEEEMDGAEEEGAVGDE